MPLTTMYSRKAESTRRTKRDTAWLAAMIELETIVKNRFSLSATESISKRARGISAHGIQSGRRCRNQARHTMTHPAYWSEKRTTSWEIWSYWELTKEVQTAKVPEKLSMAIINSRPPIHR